MRWNISGKTGHRLASVEICIINHPDIHTLIYSRLLSPLTPAPFVGNCSGGGMLLSFFVVIRVPGAVIWCIIWQMSNSTEMTVPQPRPFRSLETVQFELASFVGTSGGGQWLLFLQLVDFITTRCRLWWSVTVWFDWSTTDETFTRWIHMLPRVNQLMADF